MGPGASKKKSQNRGASGDSTSECFPGVSSEPVFPRPANVRKVPVSPRPVSADAKWDLYPFEVFPTAKLKRDFYEKQTQLSRVQAEFPDVEPDPNVDWRDDDGPFSPAKEIGRLIAYLDLERMELAKRGVKLPPRKPIAATAEVKAEAAPNNRASQPTMSRCDFVNSFIAKLTESGRKITRKDVWSVAGYKDRTEFERFQRGSVRTTQSAINSFNRVLAMKPEDFISILDKEKTPK
jgi:hypothetical protein